MSKRVKETDFKALIKSFFGVCEEDFQSDDISDEEAIRKCKEVTEEVKGDLLSSVKNRAKLEAMLDYSQKTKKIQNKKPKLKVSKEQESKEEKEVTNKSNQDMSRGDR